MATLTIQQWLDKQEKIFQALMRENKPLIVAAKDTTVLMHSRIFENGLDVGGAPIGGGAYDTKTELWVDDSKLPRKGPHTGKPNKKTGKKKQGNKTSYFENYQALRKQQGRPTDFVNLILSGRLQTNFVNSRASFSIPTKGVPIGVVRPNLGNVDLKMINGNELAISLRNENMVKVQRLEKHYNQTIFKLSTNERRHFLNILQKETIKFMRGE